MRATQARVTALTAALAKALQKSGRDELKLLGKDELRDIEVYDAETKRLAALSKQLPTDKEGLAQLIHQLVSDSLSTHLSIPILKKKNAEDDSGLAAPRATSFRGKGSARSGRRPAPRARGEARS